MVQSRYFDQILRFLTNDDGGSQVSCLIKFYIYFFNRIICPILQTRYRHYTGVFTMVFFLPIIYFASPAMMARIIISWFAFRVAPFARNLGNSHFVHPENGCHNSLCLDVMVERGYINAPIQKQTLENLHTSPQTKWS